MYTGFFGLNQAPFSIAPDPRYLFLSQRHREALAHLVYGLQAGGGFVLLTGDIGSGKTTVCRSLLQQTPPQVQLAYVFNPRLDALELLQSVCEEFRIPLPPPPHSIKSLTAALNAFLLRTHAAGQRSVLIIDEAQNLDVAVLEQLRLLTNLETDEHKLLQIMLIGQPELRTVLAQPALEQLSQRIIARYHLQALDLADTRQYIEHRLRVAGLQSPVPFTDRAVRRIHRLAQGVPRRINLLCDRALLGAYAKRMATVDAPLVDLAATEVLGQAPARTGWNARAGLGLAAALLALGIAWGLLSPASITAPAASATPAPVSPTAWSVAGAPPPSGKPSTAGMPDLRPLPDGQAPPWQALGRTWGLALPERDPCDAALQQGVQCFRTTRLTVTGLQQLDRPALLLLRHQGVSRWALVQALRDGQWQLRAGDRTWTVPMADLPRWWEGEYASLWRLPPGQRTRVFSATPQDPAGRWLDTRLQQMVEQGRLRVDGTGFEAHVRAFQRQHGLHGDGKALPSTFLLVNRLTGVDEPRLHDAPR